MATAPRTTALTHLRQMVDQHRHERASDRDLLRRFVERHDEEAFATVVRRHSPLVLGVALWVLRQRQDAEDVCQAAFLLLAQKAGKTAWRDSAAGWLYEVAHHLALKARDAARRRQAREGRAQPRTPPDVLAEITWRDLQSVLDEELKKLPPKYRAPILLCCLEGKARDEAAHCLGWPLATVKSRLEEGRELLRRRLARRGLALSAALAGCTLTGGAARAALPAGMVGTSSRAALQALTGQEVAGAISARAAALLEGGYPAMASAKVRIATAVVLVAGVLGLGAGALALHGLAAAPPVAAAEPPAPAAGEGKAPAAAPRERDGKGEQHERTVRGRVLGVDGKPLPGARLLLLGEGDQLHDLGTSAADGRFTVDVPKDPRGRYLIARADGTGIDFLPLWQLDPARSVELRVVKDAAIRGRVIDTEGKPVHGVRVADDEVGVYADNRADSFLAQWEQHPLNDQGFAIGVKMIPHGAGAVLATTTDADGRFVLRGTGAERVVTLRLSGGGIADEELRVVNRPGFDPRRANEAALQRTDRSFRHSGLRRLLHGPDLAVVAEPGKMIRGVVTAADTGKGRPGVEVWLTRSGDALDNLLPLYLKATTDADGRYEIRGARKAKSYMLQVSDDPAAGYVRCQVWADDTPGYRPVTADVRTARGVIATGRMIDQATGKGVPGEVMAAVLADNPFARDYPKIDSSAWLWEGMRPTADDGTFRVVTIPGPVILMGGPDGRPAEGGAAVTEYTYQFAVPDPRYPQYFAKKPPGYCLFRGLGGSIQPVQGNFCKVLEIKPGTRVVEQDIILKRNGVVTVQVRDADGKPLAGAWAMGIALLPGERPTRCTGDTCSAYLLRTDRPWRMVFFEPKRNLAGTLTLKGDEKSPVVARLGPAGSVKGRLLGEDGKPLAGVVVDLSYRDREAAEVHAVVHKAKQVVSDAAGAFVADGVIPGLKFELAFHRAEQKFGREPKPADPTTQVKAGESRDLGEIRVRPVRAGHGD
jgi:RNA polymerase sigma factor (sigma-70 family)